jgi:hypothetical protein
MTRSQLAPPPTVAFQCASFTWVPQHRPRLIQSRGERAAQGNVDVILVNEFVGHKDSAALARASSVPVIRVRLGYGVTAVKTRSRSTSGGGWRAGADASAQATVRAIVKR